MNRNRAIAFVIGLTVWTTVFAAILSASAHANPGCYSDNDYCRQHSHCVEDDPCWNWAKLGNERRGVVTLDGTPRIVGPCGFNRLWAHGAIRHVLRIDGERYPMNDRLRGDRFARTLTDCPWRIRQNHPYPWHQSVGRWAVKHGY